MFLLVKFRLTFTTNARRLLGQLASIKLAFSDVLVAVLKQLESQWISVNVRFLYCSIKLIQQYWIEFFDTELAFLDWHLHLIHTQDARERQITSQMSEIFLWTKMNFSKSADRCSENFLYFIFCLLTNKLSHPPCQTSLYVQFMNKGWNGYLCTKPRLCLLTVLKKKQP